MKEVFKIAIALFILYTNTAFCQIGGVDGSVYTVDGTTNFYFTLGASDPRCDPQKPNECGYHWAADLGHVTWTSPDGTQCAIQWDFPGTGDIHFYWQGFEKDSKTVRVQSKESASPPIDFYTVYYCHGTLLGRRQEPPSGTYWFWETTPDGTSEALGHDKEIMLTTTTPIYLRSRSINQPYVWGSPANFGVIQVYHIPPPPPTSAYGNIGFYNTNRWIGVQEVPGAESYVWYDRKGYEIINQTNSKILRTLKVNETIYVTTRNGCVNDQKLAIDITVLPLPQIVVQSGGSPDVRNGPVTLATNPNFDSYQWKLGGNVLPCTGSTCAVSALGTYTVTVTKTGVPETATSPPFVIDDESNTNYIRTNTILTKDITDAQTILTLPIEKRSESIQYFDGLGRANQTVLTQGSPNQKDVVQPISYDDFGRETNKYLPFVMQENNGWYKSDVVGNLTGSYTQSVHQQFYQNAAKTVHDTAPYESSTLEASPLSRPLQQYGAGQAWQPSASNKYVAHTYTANVHGTSAGAEKIIAWTLNSDGALVRLPQSTGAIESGGYYASNQLYLHIQIDEQGNAVREYTNKEGKLILKKVQAIAGSPDLNDLTAWACTYYVYDDLNQLRYVIQPELSKAVSSSESNPDAGQLAKLAFQYQYDARGRLVIKQVPGAEPVYFVYDDRDRLVLTQDGNQRSGPTKYWTFTKYDDLNRPVITGIKDTTASLSQTEMQIVVNQFYSTHAWALYGERYVGAAPKNVHGYINKSYPVSTGTVNALNPDMCLTVTYYDTYDFKKLWPQVYNYQDDNLQQTVNGVVYDQRDIEFTKVKGKPTGTKVKVLDGGVTGGVTWLRTANYYDDKYRVIQTVGDNYKGGLDRVSTLYDFVGKVIKTLLTHTSMDISWKDNVAFIVKGNKLVDVGTTGWGNSGAASQEILPAGQDGWMEFTVTETITNRMLGLSSANLNANYTSINYALYPAVNGALYIYENGSQKAQIAGGCATGDTLRIQRISGVIKYYKNRNLIGTSATSSSSQLMADAAFYANGSTLSGVRSSFSSTQLSLIKSFDYDHAGRLINSWHKLNQGDPVLLSHLEYNELGQLVDKKLHSLQGNGADAMQSIDYQYNIRGWLRSINNASLTSSETEPKDFFGMNINYQEAMDFGSDYLAVSSGLVSQYKFDGNPNDQTSGALNGTVSGATLTADAQGNNNQAYSFNGNLDNIRIANSEHAHAFIKNTGTFTISAFVKISNLAARSMIVANTSSGTTKGFLFMYETYGSTVGTHQLRFAVTVGQTSYFQALGAQYTINDTNWHHVAVVGDGKNIRFYVDGVQDGSATAITMFDTGDAQFPTLIGNTCTTTGAISTGGLGMHGAIDEVNIFNRPLSQAEIQALAQRNNPGSVGDTRLFNGNISSIQWSHHQGLGDVKQMGYAFRYDPLNRLTAANHFKGSANNAWMAGSNHERNITYDLQGNIQTLSRYDEKAGPLDLLIYNYGSGATYGNQLLSVNDRGDQVHGFLDGAAGASEYSYDANGNLSLDYNKAIGSITYNYLNLPDLVTRGGGTVQYIYDASGRKLTQVATYVRGQKQVDYVGDLQYENDELQSVQHAEGRVMLSSEKMIYKQDGTSIADVSANNGVTVSTVALNGGETYVQMTSDGTAYGYALFGGAFPVQEGEIYKIRIKGYYPSATTALYIIARPNVGSSLGWPGTALQASPTREGWVEQTFVMPSGATQLSIGLGWGAPVATSKGYVNDIELIKITQEIPEYQYDLKDHLGNVRVTFTTKNEQNTYTGTLEDNTQSTEQNTFKNYTRVTNDLFDHTDAASVFDKAVLLNGGNNAQVALAKSLAVSPGDVIQAEVYAKYLTGTGSSSNLLNFATALLSAFSLPTPAVGETGTASAGVKSYGDFIASGGNTGNTNWPKGWLNILVFDKNYNLVDIAYQQLNSSYSQPAGVSTKAPFDYLNRTVTIKEPGYVYIYLSNEGAVQQDIYFDDLKITHTKSNVIQAQDYYPFGLTFNSYSRENSLPNYYQYNGKELQDELNLGWLDYGARMYMPELGRWGVLDPMTEEMRSYSPYNFSFNNPVLFLDYDGMEADVFGNYTFHGYAGLDGDGYFSGAPLGDAPQSARKTNVAIAIESTSNLKDKKNQYDRGTWHVIMALNFEEASAILEEYLQGEAINNLVVFAHGGSQGGLIQPFGSSGDYLSAKTIKMFNEGQRSDKKMSGPAVTQLLAIQKIVNNVKDNGSVLFSTCWACAGSNEKEFAGAMNILTKQKVQLFFNKDYSNRTYLHGYVEIWTGKPLTPEKALKDGWIKVKPNGEIVPLRVGNKSGNIRLDSRVGKDPIQIE
jgi:RHS repeat-associated protein